MIRAVPMATEYKWKHEQASTLLPRLWWLFCHARFEYGFGPRDFFVGLDVLHKSTDFGLPTSNFTTWDLTSCGHFDTPVDGSKNFLRKNVRAHALYQPTKCQPARPRVYRLVHFYQPLLPTLAAILPRPLDRSKKFLRKNVRAHALYQPTKFQPARPSHLRVYKEEQNTILSDTPSLAYARLGIKYTLIMMSF